jgi:hypothetical protein
MSMCLLACTSSTAHAAAQAVTVYTAPITTDLPEDISFCIADLKFNESTLKVCELGEGFTSRFKGYSALYGKGKPWSTLWEYLHTFKRPVWVVDAAFFPKNHVTFGLGALYGRGGMLLSSFNDLELNPKFMRHYQRATNNNTLGHGIIFTYTQGAATNSVREFRKRYPQALIIGTGTNDFVRSKDATDKIMRQAGLGSFRPKSKLYTKTAALKKPGTVLKDFSSKVLVIKPVDAALGNGVIIVNRKHFKATIERIFSNKKKTKAMSCDNAYSYWLRDKNSSFLVEEFVHSKSVFIDDKPYDATMRVAFVLSNIKGVVSVAYLGSYWKLPTHSLGDKGTLNDLHKSHVESNTQSSLMVDNQDYATVQSILNQMLPQLYVGMLSTHYQTATCMP